MRRAIGLWSAALALLLMVSGAAAAAAPVNPYGVGVAGDHIIAFDEDQALWRRGKQAQDVWSRVEFDGALKTAKISGITCASDGSGHCLLVFEGDQPKYLIYEVDTGRSHPLDWTASAPVLFADKSQIYFTRVQGGEHTLNLYKVESQTSTSLGVLASNEILQFFGIDGVVQPVALASTGTARALRPDGRSVPVRMPYSDSMIRMRGRIVLPEEWSNDTPIIPGKQTISVMELGTADPLTGAVGTRGGPLLSLTREKGALAPQSLRTDANQDLIGQIASPEGRKVGLLCHVDNGRGFASFMSPPQDALVEITGSEAGAGFIVRVGDLMTSGSYSYLSFPAADTGYASRKCADLKLNRVDLGIAPRRTGAEFEKVTGVARAADGAQTPYTIFRHKGVAPKHLIIDVYGAYGALIGRGPFPEDVLAELKRTGTAVVTPLVRGDGNLGYERGVASRPPNRLKAVEDVVAVAEQLAVDYPGLKPMVRGRSAGGWLAVRTALERPDLFSGAVGLSGAYKVMGLKAVSEGNQRFFSPEDDLSLQTDKLKAACPQMKFRFLHARDDWKLPHSEVETFVDLVKSAGCSAELMSFDAGGHNIDIPLSRPDDAVRRLHGYYEPFAP